VRESSGARSGGNCRKICCGLHYTSSSILFQQPVCYGFESLLNCLARSERFLNSLICTACRGFPIKSPSSKAKMHYVNVTISHTSFVNDDKHDDIWASTEYRCMTSYSSLQNNIDSFLRVKLLFGSVEARRSWFRD
jgi:hypothetical protein